MRPHPQTKGDTPTMTDPAAPQQPQPASAAPFTEAEDKQNTVLATFLNIIPLIPALIFYFGFKDRGPRIRVQATENLNWTLNVTAVYVVVFILNLVTIFVPFIGILWFLINLAVFILNLIFSIMGGMRLNNNQDVNYRYPFAVRVIK
jgi:uncharacterized protein